MLRQFPAALKLVDRALDITPDNQAVMAAKGGICQAQGNLQEAARFLSEISWQSPSESVFITKITQLQLERNYGEAIRLLQARLAQVRFDSSWDRANEQAWLFLTQRFAGDTAGVKITANQARDTLEQLYRDQPDNFLRARCAALLSWIYVFMRQKDSALEAAERAIMLYPRAKDAVDGPTFEENLVFIQTMVGENSAAISTLTQLLQTPYHGCHYEAAPITPALLRLDPVWDSLRTDPRFQKLCEEKQP